MSTTPSTPAASAPEEALQPYLQLLPKDKSKQIVAATILDIGSQDVLLDLGLKADGVLSISEFKDRTQLKAGDQVEVFVEAQENRLGELRISRRKARIVKTWRMIEEALAEDKPLKATVLRTTKGGLVVDIDGVEAFCPGSQIELSAVKEYSPWVGQSIEVLVLKMNAAKANIVVSRKAFLKKEMESQRREVLAQLQVGQILEGIVKNITHFGVFVDLGGSQSGIVGLVYVKHMVWDKKVDHPEKALDAEGNRLFEVGKKVRVVVLDYDHEKNHVSLATKPLLPNPWDNLADNFKAGVTVSGTVTKLVDGGALVELSEGIEGFLPTSEMSHSTYSQQPDTFVEIGQQLEVIILSLDKETQDLRVGRKQLTADPWQEEAFRSTYGLDSRHKATVRRLTPEGTYLELAPGVQGYLGLRHLSWTKRYNHPREVFKRGQQVEVVVLSIDVPSRLLKLGYRECQDSPWPDFQKTFAIGTLHQGTIIKKLSHGYIVQLPHELETFVTSREMTKQDKSVAKEGETLEFVITDFIRGEERVLISHTATFDKSTRLAQKTSEKKHNPRNFITAEKAMMGNLASLSELKKQLANQERQVAAQQSAEEAPASAAKQAETPKQQTETTQEKKQ